MKYFNYLFIAALALLLCTACDKNDEGKETPASSEAGYLVMFYGIGDENLNQSLITNIFQALDAGSDDNVKMTFQYKAPAKWAEKYPAFQGTRRITGDENAQMKGKLKSYIGDGSIIDATKYDELFAQLKTEKIGGADYDMTCSDSLAAFIKWSKEKYPKAKRTILVMAGHGRGWTLSEDAKVDTRAILPDNDTQTFMSINNVVNGVKSAGNVDVIYADACLMGMYETLYGYADCAKYLLASMEPTPENGGDYTTFINLLKTAGTSDEGLQEAMHKHCDHCVNEWWPKGAYSDIGFYNLTKLNDDLTPVLRKAVDALVEKFKSNESVNPSKEGTLPLGDTYGKYISNAFMKCEIVDAKIKIYLEAFSRQLQDRLNASDVDMSDNKALTDWLCAMYQGRDKEEKSMKLDIENAVLLISDNHTENSFSLTDLLRNLDNSLIEAGARNNPFGTLRKDLISALKKIAYIKSVTPQSHPGIDEEYELCSPGILIVPFTPELYNLELNARNDMVVYPDVALKNYQLTAFDRQIGWSRILEVLDVFPSFLSNPTRAYVK